MLVRKLVLQEPTTPSQMPTLLRVLHRHDWRSEDVPSGTYAYKERVSNHLTSSACYTKPEFGLFS